MARGSILLLFGTDCCRLVHFPVIWYHFSGFGMLHQEKSGNPALDSGGLFVGQSINRESGERECRH
jgi:hypothetical protein